MITVRNQVTLGTNASNCMGILLVKTIIMAMERVTMATTIKIGTISLRIKRDHHATVRIIGFLKARVRQQMCLVISILKTLMEP